ncbi:MAG: hypothetical protein QM831_16125 [Kofleriaceae bacterium]
MTPRRIVLAAWIVFVLFGYPGFMRADAVDMLVDSRVGEITDWHSPMFTEVWRVLGRVVSGPAPMFLLQGTLLLLGAYSLLCRVTTEKRAAIGAAIVTLFPPLISTTALVSEDGLLASTLVAGTALLLAERKISGVLCLVIACGLQEGSAIAALPLILVASRSKWRAVLAWFACAVVGIAASHILVGEPSHRRQVALAEDDIVGTIANAPALDDAKLHEQLAGIALTWETKLQDHARHAYQHADDKFFAASVDEAKVRAARRALSRAYPMAYAKHRFHDFVRVLDLSRGKGWRTFYGDFIAKGLRASAVHDAHHSLVQRALIWPVKALSRTFLFRPFVYFFLALSALGFAIVKKKPLAAMILISGVIYELGLGIVASAPDYHDSHWMMTATVIALLALLLEPRHERVGQ